MKDARLVCLASNRFSRSRKHQDHPLNDGHDEIGKMSLDPNTMRCSIELSVMIEIESHLVRRIVSDRRHYVRGWVRNVEVSHNQDMGTSAGCASVQGTWQPPQTPPWSIRIRWFEQDWEKVIVDTSVEASPALQGFPILQ